MVRSPARSKRTVLADEHMVTEVTVWMVTLLRERGCQRVDLALRPGSQNQPRLSLETKAGSLPEFSLLRRADVGTPPSRVRFPPFSGPSALVMQGAP